MPPIDPHQLLKALSPLLTQAGAIKGPTETKRIVSLMKEAHKLVTRCVYINILRATVTDETLEKFIEVGGWDVLNSWLQDYKEADNFPVLVEMLKVYQQLPVTVDLLKKNNSAKTIKQFSKSGDDRIKSLSVDIVDKWMKKVRGGNENSSESSGKQKKKKTNDKKEKSEKVKKETHHHHHHNHKHKTSQNNKVKDEKPDINKLTIKDEQEDLCESDVLNKTTGVVTQGNGLKLHIKLESHVTDSEKNAKNLSKSDKDIVKKRAATVKRPNVKFRSTGLEEDLILSKKKPINESNKLQSKRSGPDQKPKDEPPEKKSRLHVSTTLASTMPITSQSPSPVSPAEMHTKIKITPPKSKTSIHESSSFMDDLTRISDRPTGVIRRKKKSGAIISTTTTSAAGAGIVAPSTPTTTKPSTPTSPSTPISPTTVIKNSLPSVPSFYKETLETNDETKNRSPSPPVLEKRSPSPDEKTENEGSESNQKNSDAPPTLDENNANTDNDVEMKETKDGENAEGDDGEEAMDTTEKSNGGPKGLLSTGIKKNKKKKNVTWADDSNLRRFHFFELDETERENVNRPKDFNQLKKQEAMMDRKAMESARRLTNDNMVEAIPWRRPPLIDGLIITVDKGSQSTEKQVQKEREKGVLQAIFFSKEMLPDTPSEPDLETVEPADPKFIPLEDENSTGEDFSYNAEAQNQNFAFDQQNPALHGPKSAVDPLLGQFNLTPEIANVLQSFQQGGTLPPNLDPASAQNILASMMSSMGDPSKTEDAFEKLKNILEPLQGMPNHGPQMGAGQEVMQYGPDGMPLGPNVRVPPPGQGLLGTAPPGFAPMMGPPGGPPGGPRFAGPGGPPGGPGRGRGEGGDEWCENMVGGPPPMRGRGRAGIPLRGGGRMPPPGHQGGPGPGPGPRGPPPPMMRGGGNRGGRMRPVNPDRPVCRHFAAGGCRRGNTCSFLHPGVNGPPIQQ